LKCDSNVRIKRRGIIAITAQKMARKNVVDLQNRH
jgi:hypothetical protein